MKAILKAIANALRASIKFILGLLPFSMGHSAGYDDEVDLPDLPEPITMPRVEEPSWVKHADVHHRMGMPAAENVLRYVHAEPTKRHLISLEYLSERDRLWLMYQTEEQLQSIAKSSVKIVRDCMKGDLSAIKEVFPPTWDVDKIKRASLSKDEQFLFDISKRIDKKTVGGAA